MVKCSASKYEAKIKRIHIFENGLKSFGMPLNISAKTSPTWNTALNYITKVLMPRFGPVRKIVSRDGKKVINSIAEMENNKMYVACGKEPFVKILGGYRTETELSTPKHFVEHYVKEDNPDFKTLQETRTKNRTIIFLFPNGSDELPIKLVLTEHDLNHWSNILDHIGTMLDMPTGCYQLYTIHGRKLCGPYELQHGGCYVALSHGEKFIEKPYVDSYDTNVADDIKENEENCITPSYKFQIAATGGPVGIWKKNDLCVHQPLEGLRIQEKKPTAQNMSQTYKHKNMSQTYKNKSGGRSSSTSPVRRNSSCHSRPCRRDDSFHQRPCRRDISCHQRPSNSRDGSPGKSLGGRDKSVNDLRMIKGGEPSDADRRVPQEGGHSLIKNFFVNTCWPYYNYNYYYYYYNYWNCYYRRFHSPYQWNYNPFYYPAWSPVVPSCCYNSSDKNENEPKKMKVDSLKQQDECNCVNDIVVLGEQESQEQKECYECCSRIMQFMNLEGGPQKSSGDAISPKDHVSSMLVETINKKEITSKKKSKKRVNSADNKLKKTKKGVKKTDKGEGTVEAQCHPMCVGVTQKDLQQEFELCPNAKQKLAAQKQNTCPYCQQLQEVVKQNMSLNQALDQNKCPFCFGTRLPDQSYLNTNNVTNSNMLGTPTQSNQGGYMDCETIFFLDQPWEEEMSGANPPIPKGSGGRGSMAPPKRQQSRRPSTAVYPHSENCCPCQPKPPMESFGQNFNATPASEPPPSCICRQIMDRTYQAVSEENRNRCVPPMYQRNTSVVQPPPERGGLDQYPNLCPCSQVLKNENNVDKFQAMPVAVNHNQQTPVTDLSCTCKKKMTQIEIEEKFMKSCDCPDNPYPDHLPYAKVADSVMHIRPKLASQHRSNTKVPSSFQLGVEDECILSTCPFINNSEKLKTSAKSETSLSQSDIPSPTTSLSKSEEYVITLAESKTKMAQPDGCRNADCLALKNKGGTKTPTRSEAPSKNKLPSKDNIPSTDLISLANSLKESVDMLPIQEKSDTSSKQLSVPALPRSKESITPISTPEDKKASGYISSENLLEDNKDNEDTEDSKASSSEAALEVSSPVKLSFESTSRDLLPSPSQEVSPRIFEDIPEYEGPEQEQTEADDDDLLIISIVNVNTPPSSPPPVKVEAKRETNAVMPKRDQSKSKRSKTDSFDSKSSGRSNEKEGSFDSSGSGRPKPQPCKNKVIKCPAEARKQSCPPKWKLCKPMQKAKVCKAQPRGCGKCKVKSKNVEPPCGKCKSSEKPKCRKVVNENYEFCKKMECSARCGMSDDDNAENAGNNSTSTNDSQTFTGRGESIKSYDTATSDNPLHFVTTEYDEFVVFGDDDTDDGKMVMDQKQMAPPHSTSQQNTEESDGAPLQVQISYQKSGLCYCKEKAADVVTTSNDQGQRVVLTCRDPNEITELKECEEVFHIDINFCNLPDVEEHDDIEVIVSKKRQSGTDEPEVDIIGTSQFKLPEQ